MKPRTLAAFLRKQRRDLMWGHLALTIQQAGPFVPQDVAANLETGIEALRREFKLAELPASLRKGASRG